MRMNKFLTFLLTLAMVVSMLPAAAFAANNTATTMRLAKTQGTVAVTNATGKKVTQTSNMKLYNGYKIKTGAKSYAWISLDNTKAAKLDANSVVSVQKNGQKLTLYLSSGNLFFNVKDPLKSGESFHIKTSTMTTGIRGTSGCVRVINDRVTEIHLLTGQVEVYTENPELNISKMAVLKAGQKATSLIAEEAMAATGEQADIIIEQLTHEEVCGNCSKEIAADPALVERIRQEAPHLLPEKIAAEDDERLAADEAAAEEKQAAIDEKVAQQVFPEEVDPYFEEEESSGGGGGNSAVTPSKIVEVSSWEELRQAIIDYNGGSGTTEIRLMEDINSLAETTTLPTVEAQNALTLNLRTHTLTLNDTLINESDLTITNADGYLIGPGDYMKETVNNKSGATLTLMDGQIDGNDQTAVVNEGTFYMKGGELLSGNSYYTATTLCALENTAGAVAYISGGTLMGETGINAITTGVENKGTVTISGNAVFEDLTIAVSTLGDVTMTGGTMYVAEGTGISALGGVITLKGGEILVDDANGVGVDVYAYDDADPAEVILDGAEIEVTDGLGMLLGVGNIRLRSGMISADVQNSSIAVAADTGFTQSMILESINAMIRAKDTDEVFVIGAGNDLPDGYTLKNDTANSGYYILTEGSAITTWAQFVAAVDRFNAGTKDMTITLETAIPAATETGTLETLNTIANNGATLTINLNNFALTLPQTMENAGDLEITGDGTISADYSAVTTLIQNSGTVELADATLNLSMNQTGIANAAGIVNMTGGQINLNNQPSYGINSDGGAVNMTGGNIALASSSDYLKCYGINGVNTAITINGGMIYETADATEDINYAVYADGGSLKLESGSIQMNNGQAVGVSDISVLTLDGATVLAKDADKLLVAANGVETGYTYSEYDTTYFELEKAVPNTVVNTWEQFVAAVTAFNGSSEAQIITLAANLDPSQEMATAYALPAIGNGTSSDLTIDLGTYSLGLPRTLATATSSGLVIKGTTGSITTGQAWDMDSSAYLINNYTELTLEGGTIDVPHGVVGVNNSGTFNMESGSMNVAYTTGIQNSGTVNLNAGTIAMPAAGAPEGVTEETSIAYSAYMTSGTGAELNLKGTNITMADGINYVFTDANGDDVNSPAVAVNNEAGNTVTMTAGTIMVNSDLGISNKGTLNISGGTINVNADSGENVKGIENFGTFEQTDGTINVNGYGIGVYNGDGGSAEAGAGTTYNVKNVDAFGVENAGVFALNGVTIDARSGNAGGTGVSNTGTLTMTDGTIWADCMPGIGVIDGIFTMTDGEIRTNSYYNAAVRLTGGEATLEGGEIIVNSNGGGEKGVSVAAATELTLDGGTIIVNGHSSNTNYKNYGIYDNGGILNINSGMVKAVINTAVADTGTGNAYAMYTSTGAWDNLTMPNDDVYDRPAAEICSTMEGLVYLMNPTPEGVYGYSYDDTEELYYLWNVN